MFGTTEKWLSFDLLSAQLYYKKNKDYETHFFIPDRKNQEVFLIEYLPALCYEIELVLK
jgi:hypothetical protein